MIDNYPQISRAAIHTVSSNVWRESNVVIWIVTSMTEHFPLTRCYDVNVSVLEFIEYLLKLNIRYKLSPSLNVCT